MFVYSKGPVDFWAGWSKPEDVVSRGDRHREDMIDPQDFDSFLQRAQDLARQLGWEGDMRQGPFIGGMAHTDSYYTHRFSVAWKQDNNGSTFVASPYELPYLKDGNNWIDDGVDEDRQPEPRGNEVDF